MSKQRNLIWGGDAEDRSKFEMPLEAAPETKDDEFEDVKFKKKGVTGFSDKERQKIEKKVHNKAHDAIKHYLDHNRYWKKRGLAEAIGEGIESGEYRYTDVMDALRSIGMYNHDEGARTYLKKRQKEFDRAKRDEEEREKNQAGEEVGNGEVQRAFSNEDLAMIMAVIDDSRAGQQDVTTATPKPTESDESPYQRAV